MKNSKLQKIAGYLLIESMVAITVILVGLLGIFSLLSQSLSLNRVVSDRYVASYLGTEGVEIIKNIIDNNVLAGRAWNSGLAAGKYQFDYRVDRLPAPCASLCTKVLYFDTATNLYSYDTQGKQTGFVRVVSLEPAVDADGLVQKIKVNSIMTWSSRGGGRFSVNVEDQFYNYR